MEQTLLKVKHLEKFVKKHGEDAFVSQTISKMLAYKVQKSLPNNGAVMKTALSKFDEILVKIGRYASQKELIQNALRTLLRAKPELKRDVAIELYNKNEVSLSRAAEICGLNIEDFKELLKEKGLKITVPSIFVEEVDEDVAKILEAVR